MGQPGRRALVYPDDPGTAGCRPVRQFAGRARRSRSCGRAARSKPELPGAEVAQRPDHPWPQMGRGHR